MQKTNSKKSLYRISFLNHGTMYEIYAKKVSQGDIFGFIEVQDIIFGEASSVVVDPNEEKLKNEFNGVKRTLIPMHSVVRIDMVEKEGTAKITTMSRESNNVATFPSHIYQPPKK